jgi:hypothetical protein
MTFMIHFTNFPGFGWAKIGLQRLSIMELPNAVPVLLKPLSLLPRPLLLLKETRKKQPTHLQRIW